MAVCSEEDNPALKKNKLPVLELIEECQRQRCNRIDLCKKGLLSLPVLFFDLKHIQYLYLDGNSLENLPEIFAESFPLLTWLDIRNNKIKSLPGNILLLKNLKNLLLEGNQISSLPLQLGLLFQLSGLNLKNNPLQFPPKNVIQSGTKEILSYLREQLAVEQRFGKLEITDQEESCTQVKISKQMRIVSKKKDVKKKDAAESPVEYCETNEIYGDDELTSHNPYRRLSLEDDTLLYSVNPMVMKTRTKFDKSYVPPLRKRELSSAPVSKTSRRRNTADVKKLAYDVTKSNFHREVQKAEKKKFNEKADAIIQKQKNKIMLDDWRRQTKDIQRVKFSTRHKDNHEFALPYGNDLEKSPEILHAHTKLVADALENGPPQNVLKALRDRQIRDKQLKARIEEHVRHIKDWKTTKSIISAEEEIKVAKNNLDQAIKLQKELDEKRALEYRLKAFTAEDYAPASYTNKKYAPSVLMQNNK